MIKRTTLYNSLCIVVSLSVVCLSAELFLRLVGYVPPVVPPYLYENHPVTWWTLRPNYVETVPTPRGPVKYTVNSQGVRASEDYPHVSEGDVRRIFLVGDSYVFGQGVELEETAAHYLEELLRAEQFNVEVINLGVPGFGTMHSYFRLVEYSALLGKPEIVVYAFTPNDPVDSIAGQKEVVNGIRIDSHRSHKKLLSAIAHLHYRSRLVGWVLTKLYPSFNPRLEKAEQLNAEEQDIRRRQDFKATVEYISRMSRWARDNQVEFNVMINEPSEYSEPLREWLERADVDTLNAEQFISKYKSSHRRVYLRSGHWSAAGHHGVARGLAEHLVKDLKRDSQ